jgi:hypothetical protein
MPATVYVLFETSHQTGSVIGVFAARNRAIEAALSWALWRARRCHEMDLKTYGPADAASYDVVVSESEGHTRVGVVHCPSGEPDDFVWRVSPTEIIGSPADTGLEQPEVSPLPHEEDVA